MLIIFCSLGDLNRSYAWVSASAAFVGTGNFGMDSKAGYCICIRYDGTMASHGDGNVWDGYRVHAMASSTGVV